MAKLELRSDDVPSQEDKSAGVARLDSNSKHTSQPNERMSNQASASNAVLLTTELLENILRSLPAKDLLLAQRVSLKWRDVIAGSRQLQRQLSVILPPATPCYGMEMKEPDEPPTYGRLSVEDDEEQSGKDGSICGDDGIGSWDR
ncbi:hypothetical protein LTR12_000910 [Friedmanniomyces endolithicus]|nr:hypothetical protein LTR74_012400 [Friedmanniomyces endolithicus]KAK1824585.1 hypothetical protein LTR12_000910 [Friedmanniomyces endolithicus]